MAKNLSTSDNYEGFNRLYMVEDPWEMNSAREQARFHETNRFIQEHVGHVGSLLEIGSGEGHQSLHLMNLCDRFVGIDVSERAVLRAQDRVPGGTFLTSDIAHLSPDLGPFDLVVACEMLYTVKDIPATLDRMSALGRACLVTFFADASRIVAPHLASLPIERHWMHHYPTTWLFALWRPGADTTGRREMEPNSEST